MAGVSKVNRRNTNGIMQKQCNKCHQWLEETTEYFYYRNKKKPKLGLCSQCKTCMTKDASKRQYEKYHKGNLKEYYEKLAIDKKEELREYQYNYYKDNAKRRDAIKEYGKKYRKLNPDKTSAYCKFRNMNKTHTLTKEQWNKCKQYFDNSCAYCGMTNDEHKIKYGKQLHREHVDHMGSNGIENCIPACMSCNSSKHTFTLNEWYNENNTNYSTERYNKIQQWLNQDCFNT